MNHAPNRNWGFAGLLAVVLWVVGIALETLHGPADHAGGARILGFYKSHTDTILVGGWLFMLGCLAFLCLVAALRPRLEEAAGPLSPLPALALVGAGVAATLAMLMAACDVAGAIDKSEIGPTTAASFHHSTDALLRRRRAGGGACSFAGAAVLAFRTQVLPTLVGGAAWCSSRSCS